MKYKGVKFDIIFDNLTKIKKFQIELSNSRNKLDIPKEGISFGNNLDFIFKDEKIFIKELSRLVDIAISLLSAVYTNINFNSEKQGLIQYIGTYLLRGANQNYKFPVHYMSIGSYKVDTIDERTIDFIKEKFSGGCIIVFNHNITLLELKNYIEEHYTKFFRNYYFGKKKPARIKKNNIKNVEQIELVKKYWSLYSNFNVSELRKINKDKSYSKYEAISKIIYKKCKIHIKTDKLRTTVSRLKKRGEL